MARLETNKTILAQAISRSPSLRTTVPIGVTKKLGLKRGDVVVWDVDKVKGKWIAIVEKETK